MIHYANMTSPIGILTLVEHDEHLTCISFADQPLPQQEAMSPLLRTAKQELDAYFGGRLRSFSIPIQMQGTPFMQKVWNALRTIPYAETVSYAQIASMIGHPNAYRAVGSSNHRNSIPIIIPCHRVVQANGALGGYAAGIKTKSYLLHLEQSHLH